TEFCAGHGGAMNAVASGFRSHVNHRIAFAGGLGVKDLIASHESESKGIHQRIRRVASFEFGFATEVGYAKAVSVRSNAADHAFDQCMILVNLGVGGSTRSRPCGRAWLGRDGRGGPPRR